MKTKNIARSKIKDKNYFNEVCADYQHGPSDAGLIIMI